MKWVAVVFLSLAAVAIAAIVYLAHVVHSNSEQANDVAFAKLRAHEAEFFDDQKVVGALDVVKPRPGGNDAGAYLNPRLSWGDEKKPLPDLSHLAQYDFWDLETDGPIAATPPRDWILAPMPSYGPLLQWAKEPGRPPSEIRELARLLYSNETLLGEMVAGAMLRAAKEPAADRLRRTVQAALAFAAIEAPDDVAARFSEIAVGRCAALNEVGHFALAMRPLLRRSREAAYVRFGNQLDSARECRLRSLRKAWREPDPPGLGNSVCREGGCRIAEGLLWLPFVGSLYGEILEGLARPDWLRGYAR